MLLQPSCFPHNNAKLRPTHFLALVSSSNSIANVHNVLASFSPWTYPATFQPHHQKNNLIENIGFRLLTSTELLLFWFSIQHSLPLILPTNLSPLENRTPPSTLLLFPAPLILHSQLPLKQISLPESHPDHAFIRSLSGFIPQSRYFIPASSFSISPPTSLLALISRALFFPQFCYVLVLLPCHSLPLPFV